MNVLSLFDGMSCGQIALNRVGIPYEKYFASEVDKHAIKVTQHNYPNTVQLGDVTQIKADSLPQIDLLMGGSPCQGFSFAGKGLNFDDPRSKLFFEFVRLLKECKPKYFLLENVKMKKEFQDVISEALGVEPIQINSALVSAQNRVRLYWTNIPNVTQPEDRGRTLQEHVMDDIYTKPNSVFCGAMRGRYVIDGVRQDAKMKTAGLTQQRLEIRYDGKTNTLTTVAKDNNVVYEPDGRPYYSLKEINYRKLNITECEKLQTVPPGYTEAVSATQRYRMLGNGWTVDVVAHILSNLK